MASSSSSGPSCHDLDNTFRIDAGSCRGGFDFSLLFEETILGILPIALILILVPFRLAQLAQKRRKVEGSSLFLFKLVSGLVYPLELIVIQYHVPYPHTIYLTEKTFLSIPDCLGILYWTSNRPDCPLGPSLCRWNESFDSDQCCFGGWGSFPRSAVLHGTHALCQTISHSERLPACQPPFRYRKSQNSLAAFNQQL